MARSIVRNKRALSPVIATVILVSVTIVVAVSVAYWMGTIAGGYTAFEQIELPTAYATYNSTLFGTGVGGWDITIELKNTGSADATISGVFLNAIPLKDYTSGTINLYSSVPPGGTPQPQTLTAINVIVTRGSSGTLFLQVRRYDDSVNPATGVKGCTAGTRIDIKIHSASGKDYPVQVKLP